MINLTEIYSPLPSLSISFSLFLSKIQEYYTKMDNNNNNNNILLIIFKRILKILATLKILLKNTFRDKYSQMLKNNN